MLYLRKMDARDREMVRSWRNQTEVSHYMYSSHHISKEEHRKWFDSVTIDNSKKYWVIEVNDIAYGLVNLYDIDYNNKKCYWAYYIGEEDARGKGIGTGVEYTILNYVFNNMKLNKLCCEVLLSNERVWRLHEHFGFTREALYRQHIRRDGTFRDVVGLAMLEQDFRKIESELRERAEAKVSAIPILVD